MPDSTTTSKEFSFSFAQPKPVFEETPLSQPYLAGPGRWDNYTDDKLYEMECLLRQWLETKRHGWGTSDPRARIFTAKEVYCILYGRYAEPQPMEIKRMNRLLNHYATKKYWRDKKLGIDNRTQRYGKKINSNAYKLSAMKLDKPPYGLRLRLEWLGECGELPTYDNMRLENDKLKHSGRNPKYE